MAMTMRSEGAGQDSTGDGAADALLCALAESAAALCLCDGDDRIRYASAAFRAAFFPQFDGRPADFTATVAAAMAAGTGLRPVSTPPEEIARAMRDGRRALAGSRGFACDIVDGTWWAATETRLSNGWILVVAQDISALKRAEARLRDAHDSALAEARTDDLTGAPNRRHGLRRAEALFKATRGAGPGLSLALLDVDHFKSINDVYGHEAGDRALVHFARHVMAAVGPEDQFSRLGGDEFLLVRPRAGAARLDADLAEILADILAALPPVNLDGSAEPLRLSISVGVAQSRRAESWPALMHRADMALYRAKAGGRDRIALAV